MEIDWWTLAIQTINFLVVVWLLSRFLYRPIRRMIEEREASDRAAAEDARAKAEVADKLKAEYEQKLSDFAEEKRKREADLHVAVQREREEMLAAARKEAGQMREAARAEIEEARTQAVTGLRDDIAALATDLAKKALSGAADPAAGLETELDRQTEDALAAMKSDLGGGGTVTLVTATAPPDDTRTHLSATLAKRLGDGTGVAFETDPALIGGIVLRLPHHVLDASVARRLADAAGAMKEGGNDA
jgi:F-type H+-transporting ATPase subunit b